MSAQSGFTRLWRSSSRLPCFLSALKLLENRQATQASDYTNLILCCTGDESEEGSQEKLDPSSSTKGKVVTDAEAAEMDRVLQDMKSLALGIQEEQGRQLQQLDLLSDSVDKANERIRTDVRKVNKLT